MTDDLIWLWAFNIIINSFLTLITLIAIVYSAEKILCLRNPRLLVFIGFLPFVKLFIDPFLYEYSSWAIAKGFDPFICEEGTRSLNLSLASVGWFFGFTVYNQWGFSIADVLAIKLGSSFVKASVVFVSLFFIFRLSLVLKEIYKGRGEINNLISHSEVFSVPIENEKLEKALLRHNVCLHLSGIVASPVATGFRSKKIILPKSSLEWSASEREAAIAHELEHLRYYDQISFTFMRVFLKIFCCLPAHNWKKRLEYLCECSCDAAVYRYQIPSSDLATALILVARNEKKFQQWGFVSISSKLSLEKRVQHLLEMDRYKTNRYFLYLQLCMVLLLVLGILPGKFWIF